LGQEKGSEQTAVPTPPSARSTYNKEEGKFDLLNEPRETSMMDSPQDPTCDEYMRMPLTEEVLDHIRGCPSCRALFNELADDVDRRAFGFEHRN
jgi:hypothetical protein